MPLGGLHVVVRVADDVLVIHMDGAFGAIGVLGPSPPDRAVVMGDQNGLVRVEGPTVVSGEPRNVRRVCHNQHLDAVVFHGRSNLAQSLGVLLTGERQSHVWHVDSLHV